MSADKINDGGPAFPEPAVFDAGRGEVNPATAYGFAAGMTLRDYFAAKAMQGLCANPGGAFQANDRSGWGMVNCTDRDLAGLAYSLADAMLKARSA